MRDIVKSDKFGAASVGGPIQTFYSAMGSTRLPTVDHAEGIYLWDTRGRRYIDASSGPIACNIGYGNERVIDAAMRQIRQVAYASRMFFENEPNRELAELVAQLSGSELNRVYFTSGGSESTDTAIKLARQYAIAHGEASRWKVIAREPGYHGGTLGAVAVSGDPVSDNMFGPMMRPMPKVPAPLTYRLPPQRDVASYALECADALERAIEREGPETVLAFIMEPVGGLASGALVAADVYYERIRRICSRYGVLLIFDEVMSGGGRTGAFLAAHHWRSAMPDLVTLAKGLGAGYTPLGAVLAPNRMVEVLVSNGGFQHGFTYAANPLSCAVGHAVVKEVVGRSLIQNAADMGRRLRQRLEAIKETTRILGDVRGRGLLMAIEIVADKDTKELLPDRARALPRIVELGMQRGLLLYSRRTANGRYGEWLMVAPPLIVTAADVDEIAVLIGETLQAFEAELRQAGILG